MLQKHQENLSIGALGKHEVKPSKRLSQESCMQPKKYLAPSSRKRPPEVTPSFVSTSKEGPLASRPGSKLHRRQVELLTPEQE